ncbi:MAG TPA: toprim domain-containing protein, partial [Acholeplasmataceae bacterium]|nr:toprim domain-containing protein [Acholeplasmataceae bacterium]
DLNIKQLFERIKTENITEIIIATSATIEGEMTALYINNALEGQELVVSRIGYGLPAGGDIEYADEITLIKALEGRKKM